MYRLARILLGVAGLLMLFVAPKYLFSSPDQIEVLCKKSVYVPDVIHLKKGRPAKIVLRSQDVTHGFAVDELNIAREVAPGPPTVVTLTPDRAGSFPFYCVVRCGKGHLRMRGTLVVE